MKAKGMKVWLIALLALSSISTSVAAQDIRLSEARRKSDGNSFIVVCKTTKKKNSRSSKCAGQTVDLDLQITNKSGKEYYASRTPTFATLESSSTKQCDGYCGLSTKNTFDKIKWFFHDGLTVGLVKCSFIPTNCS